MRPNEALRTARLTANLGQAELADALNQVGSRSGDDLHCNARHIAKWESGEIRWPQARYRRALESVLGIPCGLLGFEPPADDRPNPPGTSLETPPRPDGGHGVPSPPGRPLAPGLAVPSRFEYTGGRGARGSGSAESGHASYLDGVEGTLRELQSLERRLGSGQLLPLIDRQVHDLGDRLRTGDEPRLTAMAAWAHTLGGWMHHDSGHHDRARELYKEGLFLAQMAGDRSMVAYLTAGMSLQAAELSRPREAVRFAQLGAAQFPRTGPVAALLAVREARGWGMLAAEREARESLHRARVAFAATGPAPEWVAFFGEGELAGAAGLLAGDLGHWDEAERLAWASVGDASMPRRAEVSYRLVLLDVLLRRGDVTGARTELEQVVPMLSLVSSDRVRRRVRAVLRALGTDPGFPDERRQLAAFA